MSPEIVIPLVIATAVGFVLIPSAIIAATSTRRSVTCPDNARLVQLRLDRAGEVKRMFTDSKPSIRDCSRWPENAGCDRRCLESFT